LLVAKEVLPVANDPTQHSSKTKQLEIQLEKAVDADNSTLFHCIKALAIREDKEQSELKGNAKYKIFMTAENIRHAVKLAGFPLRSFMSRATNVFTTSLNRLHEMLHKLGITYSRQNEIKKNDKLCTDLKKSFLANVQINKYCYPLSYLTIFDSEIVKAFVKVLAMSNLLLLK